MGRTQLTTSTGGGYVLYSFSNSKRILIYHFEKRKQNGYKQERKKEKEYLR